MPPARACAMQSIERERVRCMRQSTAKRAAERAERPETSNPSEIAAFSTTARRGGNRRKLAETPRAGPGLSHVIKNSVIPTGAEPLDFARGRLRACPERSRRVAQWRDPFYCLGDKKRSLDY